MMNARELEHMLSVIDHSVSSARVKTQFLEYLRDHGDDAVAELRRTGNISIPTENGPVRIGREEIEALVA